MTDDGPEMVPLARHLGALWRWLDDPVRGTIVLLDDSGLWVEITTYAHDMGDAEARAIAEALHHALARRMVGRRVVEVRRDRDVFSARVV